MTFMAERIRSFKSICTQCLAYDSRLNIPTAGLMVGSWLGLGIIFRGISHLNAQAKDKKASYKPLTYATLGGITIAATVASCIASIKRVSKEHSIFLNTATVPDLSILEGGSTYLGKVAATIKPLIAGTTLGLSVLCYDLWRRHAHAQSTAHDSAHPPRYASSITAVGSFAIIATALYSVFSLATASEQYVGFWDHLLERKLPTGDYINFTARRLFSQISA